MDVSSVMEALVGSSVWEQLPGAAAQAKRKLQSDLEGYQKEITGRLHLQCLDWLGCTCHVRIQLHKTL